MRIPVVVKIGPATVVAGALVASVLLAACSLLPRPRPSDYDIVVSNGTTLVLTVVVNGSPARTFGPSEDGRLPASTLGPLPWDVRVITATGRQLTTMTVTEGSTGCTDNPGGGAVRACHGVVQLVDLSCGRFSMYTAGSGSPEFPAPGPGVPGDCVP